MLFDYSFCSRSWSCLQFGAGVNSQVMCLAEVLTAVLGDVLVIDHEPFTSASEKGTFPNQCPSFGSYPVNTLLWLLHIPVGCSPNPSSRFSVLTQLVLWRDPETSLGCAGNICDPRLHLFVCLFIPLSKSSKLERSRLHYENQESFAKNSTLTFLLALQHGTFSKHFSLEYGACSLYRQLWIPTREGKCNSWNISEGHGVV